MTKVKNGTNLRSQRLALSYIGRYRLPGWGLRDNHDQWLKMLDDIPRVGSTEFTIHLNLDVGSQYSFIYMSLQTILPIFSHSRHN